MEFSRRSHVTSLPAGTGSGTVGDSTLLLRLSDPSGPVALRSLLCRLGVSRSLPGKPHKSSHKSSHVSTLL